MNQTLLKQCVAEFVGEFALIFIGLGVIADDPNRSFLIKQ
jgi:glycerol uptake facilitator-like aquaporin